MKQITTATLLIAMNLAVFGQGPSLVELTRATIQEKRQEIVTLAMSFTATEEKAFWPVYREWRARNTALGDRKLALIVKVEDAARLTDAEAKSIIDSWLQLEDESLKLKKEFVKKFRAVLPEKKIARFFQLENKLDAVVNYDLAGRVALVE